jgi:hypothetical protein
MSFFEYTSQALLNYDEQDQQGKAAINERDPHTPSNKNH